MFIKGFTEMEFDTFGTPTYVRALLPKAGSEGRQDTSLPLSAIPDDTFHQMIEEWVREMYEKAGKSRPT